MIQHIGKYLHDKIFQNMPSLHVGFGPPVEGWWTAAGNAIENALNIYLFDIRENRDLRSNELVRLPPTNGQIQEIPAPRRIDCHYLITAWSLRIPAKNLYLKSMHCCTR